MDGVCVSLWYRQMDDSHRVTVFSRDVDGRTALHIAARIGIYTPTHDVHVQLYRDVLLRYDGKPPLTPLDTSHLAMFVYISTPELRTPH